MILNMTFETPRRLRIELSKADLEELDITYDSMDYRDLHTREVLDGLLRRIGAEKAFGEMSDRTLIEVYPTDQDGCIIYFTALQLKGDERPPRMRKLILEPTVYRFDSAGDALDAIAALYAAGAHPVKCELFLFGTEYRLVTVCTSADSQCEAVLCEYGSVVGRGGLIRSITAEHGRLLSADALADIGSRLN